MKKMNEKNMGKVGVLVAALMLLCSIGYVMTLCSAVTENLRQLIALSCLAAVVSSMLGAMFLLTVRESGVIAFGGTLLGLFSLVGIMGDLGIVISNGLSPDLFKAFFVIYSSVPIMVYCYRKAFIRPKQPKAAD